MKRILSVLLVLALLLCGCGSEGSSASAETTAAPVETQAPATEAATEPTTVPTEPPVYRNPVNGQIIDEPFTGRIYATTISNLQENMPHVNLVKADIVMEMYVNMNNVVRCLALFSDIESVPAIGSIRSTRPIFNDIAQHYSLVLAHAGGSETAIDDANARGLDHMNVDAWVVASTGASYRDSEYKRSYENSLFAIGSGVKAYAESQGMAMTLEKDYGLNFQEDGTPAGGEAAQQVALTFVYGQAKKDTKMVYNAELGKYVWHQHGKEMTDQITGEVEAFTNVIIMDTLVSNNGIYHAGDFNQGGAGYYANGGQIIPITWSCDGDNEPFRYYTMDGAPLMLGQGNTYIAIVPQGSPVSYE